MTITEPSIGDLPGTIVCLQQQVDVDAALIAHLRSEARADRDTIAHLETALTSARRIGTAIGVLMSRHKVTADAAFLMLAQASQRSQRKLRDVAADVVDTGVLAVDG